MTHVSHKITINSSADVIWQLISDFGAVGRILVGETKCVVAGEGVGALRTFTNGGDSTIVERLEKVDKAGLRLSYVLLSDTPFGNCLTTMVVRALAPEQAELVWSATFQPVGIPQSEAADLLAGALADNCLALKQYLEHRALPFSADGTTVN